MKKRLSFLLLAALSQAPLSAQETKTHGAEGDLSLKLEIQHHIDRGLAFLKSKQNESGNWGDELYPALTALPLSAIMSNPERKMKEPVPANVQKGYAYLLSKQHRDGAIYEKGLATYGTSLSLMAFLHVVDQPGMEAAIRQARQYLIGQQADFDEKGKLDNPMDGGIGYGGSRPHSDLSNTHLAMEALYYSRQVLADRPGGVGQELDWKAALEFVSRCQNVESNPEPYAVTEENRGGFVYYPGNSKAGEEKLGDDKVALRSYGSMSYAGLLSFIYAQVDSKDPRVVAVNEWLGKNYSLDENPGMGAQGLFYYFHTMSKALSVSGMNQLKLEDGSKVDWKEKLALKLFDTQQPDGSWINQGSSRWWEDNPILVTSYALLALEHISEQL